MNKRVDINKIYCTWLDSIRAKTVQKITLADYIEKSKRHKALIKAYQETGQKELKANAPAIIPAVITKRGHASDGDNIRMKTGWASFDIDEFDKPLEELREDLKSCGYIGFMMKSISGNGLWGLVYFGTRGQYAPLYEGLIQYFDKTFGVKLDITGANITRLRYVALDDNIYIAKRVPRFNQPVYDYKRKLTKDGNRYIDRVEYKITRDDERQLMWSFNQSHDCGSILESAGWEPVRTDHRGRVHYLRPGSSSHATSGNVADDVFYCFTDQTDLIPKMRYYPFDLYVALEHGGNFKKAVSTLRSKSLMNFNW